MNDQAGAGPTPADLDNADLHKPITQEQYDNAVFTNGLQAGAAICHEAAKKWWIDLETGEDVRTWPQKFFKLWVTAKLFLVVSEVVESFEGLRKDKMDDHLPKRKMFVVELADTIIRLLDLVGGLGLAKEFAECVVEKLAYNAQRADHKPENRMKEGGKSI